MLADILSIITIRGSWTKCGARIRNVAKERSGASENNKRSVTKLFTNSDPQIVMYPVS